MKIENISASSYSTWDWCQWQWTLKYIMKFKDSAGFSALAGTIAHRVLEILSLTNIANFDITNERLVKECLETSPAFDFSRLTDLDYLWDVCFLYYTSKDIVNGKALAMPKNRQKIRNIKDGIQWLMTTQHNPLTTKTIHTEMSFDIDITSPQWVTKIEADGSFKYLKVRGRIDRIDELAPGVIEIIDYKSGQAGHWPPRDGAPEKTVDDFYHDFQALLYFWHYKKLFPSASIIVTFIFIAAQKSFSVAMSDLDAQRLEDKLMKRIVEIRECSDPSRTQNWMCKHMCAFGDKSGICNKLWKEKEDYGLDFVSNLYLEVNKTD